MTTYLNIKVTKIERAPMPSDATHISYQQAMNGVNDIKELVFSFKGLEDYPVVSKYNKEKESWKQVKDWPALEWI